MRKSIFETIIHSNIKNIWKIITDNEHYLWRSDISEIKIIEPHHKFIEVSKNGIQTVFTITAIKPYSLYEFDMENKYFRGHIVHRNLEYKKSYYGNTFIYMYEFKDYAEKIYCGFD